MYLLVIGITTNKTKRQKSCSQNKETIPKLYRFCYRPNCEILYTEDIKPLFQNHFKHIKLSISSHCHTKLIFSMVIFLILHYSNITTTKN